MTKFLSELDISLDNQVCGQIFGGGTVSPLTITLLRVCRVPMRGDSSVAPLGVENSVLLEIVAEVEDVGVILP